MSRVLIVDDDLALRTSLARDLSSQRHQVHSADCVEAALPILQRGDIDIVLTDLRMPDENGLDLLEHVRDISPRTRSILMSAFTTAEDYDAAMNLGAVCVLCKPFSRAQLKRAIALAAEARPRAAHSTPGRAGHFDSIVIDATRMDEDPCEAGVATSGAEGAGAEKTSRAKEIADRWIAESRQMHGLPSSITVIARTPSDGSIHVLQGELSGERLGGVAEALTNTARSLTASSRGALEIVTQSYGANVVWNHDDDVMVIAVQPLDGAGSSSWFRSRSAAIARIAMRAS